MKRCGNHAVAYKLATHWRTLVSPDSGARKKALDLLESRAFNYRDGEIRTHGLFHPKEARYQAAPRPANVPSVSLENVFCQMAGKSKSDE